jgi:hypothetical protein
MFRRVLLFMFIIFAIISCNEESPIITVTPTIKITIPTNSFYTSEKDSLLIKITADYENEIDYIELYAIDENAWYDTSNAVFTFNQKPYETYLRMPEIICVEYDLLTLYAIAHSINGKTINSELVTGFIMKDLPPDNLLTKYDYKGYDLDSNLVVEGLLTLMKTDTLYNYIEIKGRRDLQPIVEELAYEKGKGFTEGSINTIGESFLRITRCDMVTYNGLNNYSMDLVGVFTDSLFSGERHLSSMDPTVIIVGTFIAKKNDR